MLISKGGNDENEETGSNKSRLAQKAKFEHSVCARGFCNVAQVGALEVLDWVQDEGDQGIVGLERSGKRQGSEI